ncbi:hypothetical protein ACJ41O_007168 [Fusarium nematophilum]
MAEMIRLSRSLRHPAATLRPAILSPATPSTRRFSSTDQESRGVPKSQQRQKWWVTDATQRLSKLRFIKHKIPEDRYKAACGLAQRLEQNWIHMEGGRLGFVTTQDMRGLQKHEVAWGDMVSHINNVVYNRYAESARVNWISAIAKKTRRPQQRHQWAELMTPNGVGLILRSIRTDFKFPMAYPDRTTVLHKLTRAPDSNTDHVLLEAVILSNRYRRIAARCHEDIVVYDYKAGKKSKLKQFMVKALKDVWEDQEAAKPKAEKEIAEFLRELTEIEEAVAPALAEAEEERASRSKQAAANAADEEGVEVPEESVGESPETAAETAEEPAEEPVEKASEAAEESGKESSETAAEDANKSPAVGENAEQTPAEKPKE